LSGPKINSATTRSVSISGQPRLPNTESSVTRKPAAAGPVTQV